MATGSSRRPAVIMLSGVRWDFLWQRHQSLATCFAHAGYPTVFVETTGLSNPNLDAATLRKIARRVRHRNQSREAQQAPNLTVYSPLTLPPTYEFSRRLNEAVFIPRMVRDLLKITGPEPVVVAYPPTRTTLDVISSLRPRLVLYDCSDDYESFPGVPRDIARTERELLDRADLVCCTSTSLLEKLKTTRPDAFLSGPGVDYESFAPLQREPAGKVRTVCFFGDLSEERLDFRIIRAVAAAGFAVRLIGSVGRSGRRLLKTPGMDYRGEVSHADLPSALKGVDALTLPYRLNKLTRSISPAKTYECLATGKPVVASPLPAMVELREHVYLAEKPEDFVNILRNLQEFETREKMRARVELARQNSWAERFRELEEALWRKM